MIKGNELSEDVRNKLKNFKWTPNTYLDLHSLGVHYFDEDLLPTWIDPLTHSILYHRGLTPPNCLPTWFPSDIHDKIEDWLNLNYYKLFAGGVEYLGNEANLQTPDDFDKAVVRCCILRLSEYETCDGSFSHHIVAEFSRDYSDKFFFDFSYLPQKEDAPKFIKAGLPLCFGTITKRPLTDFDFVFISHSFPSERVQVPLLFIKSGIPLFRWERWSHDLPYYKYCPIIGIAGIGASSVENLVGDSPIFGIAGNSMIDHVLIGEGELMGLKYLQQYYNVIKLDNGSKEDFFNSISNLHHSGVYDPAKILFEYSDKEVTFKDPTGKILEIKNFIGGGNIKRVSLIDEENQIKYVLIGPESEEWKEMLPIHLATKDFIDNPEKIEDVTGNYIKEDSNG